LEGFRGLGRGVDAWCQQCVRRATRLSCPGSGEIGTERRSQGCNDHVNGNWPAAASAAAFAPQDERCCNKRSEAADNRAAHLPCNNEARVAHAPREEADGERPECGKRTGGGRKCREKKRCQDECGSYAVETKVIPFERRSDHSRDRQARN